MLLTAEMAEEDIKRAALEPVRNSLHRGLVDALEPTLVSASFAADGNVWDLCTTHKRESRPTTRTRYGCAGRGRSISAAGEMD